MFIATVPNRGSPPAVLLRESYREGGHVKSRTLANLSKLPADALEVLRRSLKGERLVPVGEAFEVVQSLHHGHVDAVLSTMQRLAMADLLASHPSHERDVAMALIAARILEPHSKLATTRWWHVTTLPTSLGVSEADEDDLYTAMDWLLACQARVESKLAARHLHNDGMALYDLSSSYFEGVTCPLAARGHNRDGKPGKLQVNYGLLTNPLGIPVAVSVFKGNTGDPKTLLPQVDTLRDAFGLERIVLVGDRGMITQTQIDALRARDGLDWIGALRPEAIKKLVREGALQMGLFDARNLFELTHPDFPDERLVACHNPELAKRRAATRQSLVAATAKELETVRRMVNRRRLHGQDAIGRQVRQVLGKYRIGRHYRVTVGEQSFEVEPNEAQITAELTRLAQTPAQAHAARERSGRHQKAIETHLETIRRRIDHGALYGKDAIGVRVGKVLNKYKVGKHFTLTISDDRFDFEVDEKKVTDEAALDGIYVVRTSLAPAVMSAEEAVRSYKRLSQVERAFRAFKTMDLHVRPIHHHLEPRVRAHIFLCMLAYYVQWHMFEAWRPILFADEDQQAKATRDPVAPARRSDAAEQKARSKTLEDGSQVHSFRTLLTLLSSIVKNTCRIPTGRPDAPTFEVITTPTPHQNRAYTLLKTIAM
jgi:transposase